MNGLVILFIALFVIINLFQGTLGKMLFQIGVAFLIPVGIRMLGLFGNRRDKQAVCNQLERDIQILKSCHRNVVDPELCQTVGADDATIRATIRQASVLISMLESYRGQPDRHIEELFGGRAPSRSQCAAAISELRYRRRQLTGWLDDNARRGIMLATGQFMTPSEVGDEIRRRGAAISAIRQDGSGWTALDSAVGPIAGIVTFFAFEFGILISAIYVGIRIVAALCSNRSPSYGQPLEPAGDIQSTCAGESTKSLTDISRILLGRSAGFASGARRIAG